MKSTNAKKVVPHGKIDMASLWQESISDKDFQFEIKANSVAVDLVRAISEQGLTQAQIADKLGWTASRVSRVLHSGSNLTLRTLTDFVTALNLEFDVIYRHPNQRRAPQPWETTSMLHAALSVCRDIDVMHSATQENLSKSEAMLDTARTLVRRGWNAAKAGVPVKRSKVAQAA